MTRRIIATIFVLGILAMAPAAAQANIFPYSIDNLVGYLDGDGSYAPANYSTYTGIFSGTYNVTALGTEASHTDYFYGSTTSGILFSNQDATIFGTTANNVDLTQAYFYDNDSNTQYSLDNTSAVSFYVLNSDWTVPGLSGVTLSAGTLIFGLNDSATVDGDFDDLILAATPTPIPGAVWLLGAGLMGLMGLRRTRSAE